MCRDVVREPDLNLYCTHALELLNMRGGQCYCEGANLLSPVLGRLDQVVLQGGPCPASWGKLIIPRSASSHPVRDLTPLYAQPLRCPWRRLLCLSPKQEQVSQTRPRLAFSKRDSILSICVFAVVTRRGWELFRSVFMCTDGDIGLMEQLLCNCR